MAVVLNWWVQTGLWTARKITMLKTYNMERKIFPYPKVSSFGKHKAFFVFYLTDPRLLNGSVLKVHYFLISLYNFI